MKATTVVIPVYGDWTTLAICIDSLKENLSAENTVLLVNDMGPQWKEIEDSILTSIEGDSRFRYEKNPENLGFVKTCNRAVQELDQTNNDILLLNSDTKVTSGFLEEMKRVLYLSEKHGIVCPRSNCATLLTVPVRKNTTRDYTPEESFSVYSQIKDLLPEFQIIPTGVGFAMLIKREVINEISLFDEVYGKGYNEENDFCMRANQYGYSVVMANRAYVYHFEGKSFGSQRAELDKKNYEILTERYPYYDIIVNHYFSDEIDPIDYFADQIAGVESDKKRLLISLYEFPAAYNGSSEYGCMFLKEFYDMYRDKYEIHILVTREADAFFGFSEIYKDLKIWYPDNIMGQTFYLGFVTSQIFHMEHIHLLNKLCLKFVFNMQDIISLRCRQFFSEYIDREEIFRKSIEYCDGVYYISKFTEKDTKDYFADEYKKREITDTIILNGTDTEKRLEYQQQYSLPFEEYFFVFGNKFKHKNLENTLEVLKDTKYNLIYLGASEEGFTSDNIYGYPSGNLPEEFVDYLLENAIGIVFPSYYEGFGLPILKAIKFDKKIIVRDTEVNQELREYFDTFAANMLMFHNDSDIPALMEEILCHPEVVYLHGEKKNRSWRETTIEIEAFLKKVMNQELDVDKLRNRWKFCTYAVTSRNIYEGMMRRFYDNHVAQLHVEFKNHLDMCQQQVEQSVGVKQGIKNTLRRRMPRLHRILAKLKRMLKGEK